MFFTYMHLLITGKNKTKTKQECIPGNNRCRSCKPSVNLAEYVDQDIFRIQEIFQNCCYFLDEKFESFLTGSIEKSGFVRQLLVYSENL